MSGETTVIERPDGSATIVQTDQLGNHSWANFPGALSSGGQAGYGRSHEDVVNEMLQAGVKICQLGEMCRIKYQK